MSKPDITPEILKELLASEGLKHKDLQPILSLEHPKISALMNSKRKISDSEQKLLKLYFYNEIPFDMIRPEDRDYSSGLKFTQKEWHVMGILGTRCGYGSAGEWIVSRIRADLAFMEHKEELAKQMLEPQNVTPINQVEPETLQFDLHIPAYLSAGYGGESDSSDEIVKVSKKYPRGHRGARVRGNSMDDGSKNSIPDGSIAVLDTEWSGKPFPTKDKVYAWYTDEGNKLKKFVRRKVDGKTQGFLVSLNPNYPPVPYENTMRAQGEFVETL